MNKKKLKPTSSHFLSQKFWRYSRKVLSRDLWTYLYINFQKIKMHKLLKVVLSDDLTLKQNLKYPKQKKKSKNKIHDYSYYLKK